MEYAGHSYRNFDVATSWKNVYFQDREGYETVILRQMLRIFDEMREGRWN
jgi:hypothetical protein